MTLLVVAAGLPGRAAEAPAPADATAPVTPSAPDAPPLDLDLDAAIRIAMDSNFGLRRERHRLASSQSSLIAAENEFDFKLETSLSDSRGYWRNVAFADPGPPEQTYLRDAFDEAQTLSVGLTREVRWGGRFDVTSSLSRLRGPGAPPVHASSYDLAYTHPLWGGRGRRYATASLVSARLSYLDGARTLRERQSSLVLDVTRAFYEVVRSSKLIGINATAREQAEQRRRVAELRYQEGLVTPIEVKRAERDLRFRESSVISAEESHRAARDELMFLLGLPIETPFQIRAAELSARAPLDLDVEGAVSEALAHRADVRNARDALELARLSVDVARSNMRPRIDVTVAAGFVSVPGDDDDEDADADDAQEAEKFFDIASQDTWEASLVFSHVFGERGDDEAYVQSRIGEAESRLGLDELERRISVEVRDSLRNIRSLERRLEILLRNVELAQESLDLATLQYEEGLISTTDLLADQAELVDAQTEYTNAVYDHAVARQNLDLTLGRYAPLDLARRSEHLRREPAPAEESGREAGRP
jgi:outer membrane protein TolC